MILMKVFLASKLTGSSNERTFADRIVRTYTF